MSVAVKKIDPHGSWTRAAVNVHRRTRTTPFFSMRRSLESATPQPTLHHRASCQRSGCDRLLDVLRPHRRRCHRRYPRKLPDKQCATDPLPTRLLKDNMDVLVPSSQNCSMGPVFQGVSDAVQGSIRHSDTEKAGSGPILREVMKSYQTTPFCLKLLNDSSLVSLSATSVSGSCCQNRSQHTALTTQARLHCVE